MNTPADLKPNGWNEWGKHVLEELKTARDERKELRGEVTSIRTQDLTEIKTQIAMLNVKSTMWGAAGAGIVIILTTLLPKVLG
jgi:uncharacterized protein YlxW (UPF0749 family)